MENNFFSDFDKPGKSEWLQQIEKEFGSDAEKFQNSYENIILDPFAHQGDYIQADYPFNYSINDGRWYVGTDIEFGNKSAIHSLLQNGVNAPKIIFTGSTNAKQLKEYFEGIQFDILYPIFEVNDATCADILLEFLASSYDGHVQKRCIIKLNPSIIDQRIKRGWDKNSHCITSCITENQSIGHSYDQPVKRLCSLLDSLSNETLNDSGPVAFHKAAVFLNVGNNFLMDLCYLRAFRTLIYNLKKAIKDDSENFPVLVCQLHPSCVQKTEDKNLLVNTIASVAAVLGGTDILILNSLEPGFSKSEFYRRININIQHVLHYESKIGMVKDVSAGSYFIEECTRKMAEEAWNQFADKIEI